MRRHVAAIIGQGVKLTPVLRNSHSASGNSVTRQDLCIRLSLPHGHIRFPQ